jgi:hypothetical protein
MMGRTPLMGKVEALLVLAGLAYLGFYVFGLVMGVFAIGAQIGFSVIAAAIVFAIGIYALRERRRATKHAHDADQEELQRESRHQREQRGF